VVGSLRAFARACESGGANPCIDGTYNQYENFDLPAQRFAAGEVDATFGYSERIHTVLKTMPDPAALRISSAPLGEGSRPVLFSDAYVLSAKCTGACAEAALVYAGYMTRARTFEWILMSEDAPAAGRIPRYLLPASLDAYQAPSVKQDPYYPALDAATRDAQPLPNSGLLGVKDRMMQDLQAALRAP
jgi:thiamine pyridinylase